MLNIAVGMSLLMFVIGSIIMFEIACSMVSDQMNSSVKLMLFLSMILLGSVSGITMFIFLEGLKG